MISESGITHYTLASSHLSEPSTLSGILAHLGPQKHPAIYYLPPNLTLRNFGMSTITTTLQEQIALGAAVPALTAHAISVSLPTWEDNVGYEEGDKRVMDVMVSGYPRFFIHLSIRKVSISTKT